jgi:DNA-binding NtrC family response regulator
MHFKFYVCKIALILMWLKNKCSRCHIKYTFYRKYGIIEALFTIKEDSMHAQKVGTEKIHVLLIEDSSNEAHSTQKQLYAIDHEFDMTRVSRLGDALAQLNSEEFGAVILDLGLPDSNGPGSIKTLSCQFPNLPIVVLSGNADANTVRLALEYGAQEFLSKADCSGNRIRQALLGAIIRKSLISAMDNTEHCH